MVALDEWGAPVEGPVRYQTCFVATMTAPWAARVLTLADPRPGEHVLDVACGTGVVALAAAALVGPGGRVVGLDPSPAMLAEARALPTPAGGVPVEWHEGVAGALPFPDASFDAVTCQLGLMFFPDRVAALREMGRVLRPGGRLAVMTWGALERCPGQAAMRAIRARHFGAAGAAVFGMQHALSDPAEVLALLRDAGFRDAAARAEMGTVRYAAPEVLAGAYGAPEGVAADAATRERVFAEAREALGDYTSAEGLVYPIEAVLGGARK